MTRYKSGKNLNYNNGATFERKVQKYFAESGFLAVRAAGSHGEFDVIADDGKSLWYVQCKKGGTDKFAEKLADELTAAVIKKFPMIGHPIAVMVATKFLGGKPHGVARLLVPGEDGISEAISAPQKKVSG